MITSLNLTEEDNLGPFLLKPLSNALEHVFGDIEKLWGKYGLDLSPMLFSAASWSWMVKYSVMLKLKY